MIGCFGPAHSSSSAMVNYQHLPYAGAYGPNNPLPYHNYVNAQQHRLQFQYLTSMYDHHHQQPQQQHQQTVNNYDRMDLVHDAQRMQVMPYDLIPGPYIHRNDAVDNSSNSRHQRNLAEKQRRDKLNGLIGEMASNVPMVNSCPKKANKTSILRLCVTYLRIHRILIPGTERLLDQVSGVDRRKITNLINALRGFDLSKFVLDELDGIMLVVTASGKIVFVSHTIENLLGYQQHDMFGKSLFSFTHPNDHKELEMRLKPSPSECSDNTCSSSVNDANGDDSSNSESSSSFGNSYPSPGASMSAASTSSVSSETHQNQRRAFDLRLQVRSTSGNEQPKYEPVYVVGHLRVPIKKPSSKKQKDDKDSLNSDEILLVAMLKQRKEKSITDLSLLEATRDEYITRHLVDGKIVYTDHRISVVAGYMPHEVTGITGFRYMHKEDVRWTMIALRQMYVKNKPSGKSCYRLQTKIGQFIYLRTLGYLEVGEDETVQTFVCINSLVSEKEGELLIREMKTKFSPFIEKKSDTELSAIADNRAHATDSDGVDSDCPGELANPSELEAAIKILVKPIENGVKIALKESQCEISHQKPRISNISTIVCPKDDDDDNDDDIEENKERHQQIQVDPNPVFAQHCRRQSVIRLSKNNRSSELSDGELSSDSKRMRTNEGSLPVENVDARLSNRRQAVVITQQIGSKRHHHVDQLPHLTQPQPPALSPTYSPAVYTTYSPTNSNAQMLEHPQQLPIDPAYEPLAQPFSPETAASLLQSESLLQNEEALMNFMNTFGEMANNPQTDYRTYNHLATEPVEHLVQENEVIPNELFQKWSGNLNISHHELEQRMQDQVVQFSAIKDDLQTVSVDNINSQLYINNLTKLKAQQQELSCCYKEHEEQQQELRTLRQDTLSIQQNIGGSLCPDIL